MVGTDVAITSLRDARKQDSQQPNSWGGSVVVTDKAVDKSNTATSERRPVSATKMPVTKR
ncbi:MAG TPA: hypothetical protein DHU16_05030 [Gammaproteobacteria bacterium]|nr:hypothetical protein [Gammaproteobacteria bacterium]